MKTKNLGMKISAFVLAFAMVLTLVGTVNIPAQAAEGDGDAVETVNVWRAYNPNNGEHLYTTDEAEYQANVDRGYNGEGETWLAPVDSTTEVWRAYNPNSGEHLLASESEVKGLEAIGWQNEGKKMYSDDNKGVAIYRVYNPDPNAGAGAHHYCELEEAEGLVAIGWQWDNNGEAMIYGVYEEPVILVKLTDAEQLSANSVEVTFDQPATGLVDKDDITVAAADGTVVLPINSMELSADGSSAVLNLAISFTDAKDYVVSLNDSEVDFTASVGEVATVAVLTASAKQNESTPIEYALYDEQGIDVTSTVKLSKTIQIDVEGDDVVPDVSNPNKPSLTMGTVGEIATVTITYNSNEVDAEDVVGVGEITCIEAEALQGTPLYYDIDENDDQTKDLYVNQTSQCAKFYWGLIQTTPVTVEYGKTNESIYWCAGDLGTMSVYDYDEYTVESSDDDVMSVNSDTTDGKFVKLSVTGNEVGTANVVITATKNEKDAVYTIPVRVTEEAELKSVTMTVDKSSVSNAVDAEYFGVATVKAIDSNGNVMKADDYSVDFENDPDNEGKEEYADYIKNDAAAVAVETSINNVATTAGFTSDKFNVDSVETINDLPDGTGLKTLASELSLKKNQAVYSAFGAAKSSNKINATISAGDVVKEKSVSVSVKEIDSEAWALAANATKADGVDMSYKMELSGKSINQLGTMYVKSRLAAYYKNNFVGYVRSFNDGNIPFGFVGSAFNPGAGVMGPTQTVTGSLVRVSAAKQISNLEFGVKYGSKYAAQTANYPMAAVQGVKLNDSTTNIVNAAPQPVAGYGVANPLALTAIVGVDLTRANLDKLEMAIGNKNYDQYFAKPGAYTATYRYDLGDGSEDVSLTDKVTVTRAMEDNGMYPKVTVTSRNVDSISQSDIIDNLTTLVDMNNNDGPNESITGLSGKYVAATTTTPAHFEAIDYSKTKATVKYAVVNETFGYWPKVLAGNTNTPVKVTFYVPIDATFYEE